MLEAVVTEKPGFDLRNIDIIACGSTLGNLLRFVQGNDAAFRILVEVVDNTVCFIRRENSPREFIPDVRGYGHTFPEAYTTWSAEVRGSESHQRVLKYKLAGFKCLVRFEADGYLPDLFEQTKDQAWDSQCTGHDAIESDDVLTATLEQTLISNMPESAAGHESKPLETKKGGTRIPQSAVFDMKTRSFRKKDDEDTFRKELPRMWLSQIPNFLLGYHTYGVFDDINIRDVRDDIKKWETTQRPVLTKFANLLELITSFARSTEHGRLEITREEDSPVLHLREQCADVGSALPAHMIKLWEDAVSEPDEQYASSMSNDSDSEASGIGLDWDDDDSDYTACSPRCGYCGHCK